jgi:hypothetical protein
MKPAWSGIALKANRVLQPEWEQGVELSLNLAVLQSLVGETLSEHGVASPF